MSSKAQSVLSYVGIYGRFAYFLGKDRRDDVNRYHLKQGLGLLLLGVLFSMVVSPVGFVAPILAKMLGFGASRCYNEDCAYGAVDSKDADRNAYR